MQQSDIKPVLPKIMMSQEMTKSIPELRGEGSMEDGKNILIEILHYGNRKKNI